MGVAKTTTGFTDTCFVLDRFRQLDLRAGIEAGDVDADDVVWMSEDVEDGIEEAHGGGHGVGMDPPVHLVLDPVPGVRREYLQLRPLLYPAGEGDDLEFGGVAGIERHDRALASLGWLGELPPPSCSWAEDMERGEEARVAKEQPVADVDDGRALMEGEEGKTAAAETAVRGRACVPRLLHQVGLQCVEDGGRDQGEFSPEVVVVGDESAPCFADAREPEQGLQGEPRQDLHQQLIVHDGSITCSRRTPPRLIELKSLES